jgi:hypothetical protein
VLSGDFSVWCQDCRRISTGGFDGFRALQRRKVKIPSVTDKKKAFMKLTPPGNQLFLTEYQTAANRYHHFDSALPRISDRKGNHVYGRAANDRSPGVRGSNARATTIRR